MPATGEFLYTRPLQPWKSCLISSSNYLYNQSRYLNYFCQGTSRGDDFEEAFEAIAYDQHRDQIDHLRKLQLVKQQSEQQERDEHARRIERQRQQTQTQAQQVVDTERPLHTQQVLRPAQSLHSPHSPHSPHSSQSPQQPLPQPLPHHTQANRLRNTPHHLPSNSNSNNNGIYPPQPPPPPPTASTSASSLSSAAAYAAQQQAFVGTSKSLRKPAEHKRQPIACFNCRQRRLKCDGENPCSPCQRRGVAHTCAFAQQVRRRGPGRKKLAQLASLGDAEAAEALGLQPGDWVRDPELYPPSPKRKRND